VRGVEPHFELWKYFFAVSLQKKREKKGEDLPVYLKNDADAPLSIFTGHLIEEPLQS
jgi:hypothetical protein